MRSTLERLLPHLDAVMRLMIVESCGRLLDRPSR